MIKIALIAAALTAATPALAQDNTRFVGPRIEVNAGFDDLRNARDRDDISYGASVGYDVPVGSRFTFGVEANANNVLDNEGRELGVAVRAGYALNGRVLVFARGGYTNLDVQNSDLDGLQLGGGVQYALTDNVYTTVEYRHTDYDARVSSHGARVGIGLRF